MLILWGERYAKDRGYQCHRYPANWKDITTPPVSIGENAYGKYNRLAGRNRNRLMGDTSHAAVIFWNGVSTGSKDMLTYMKSLNKPVRICHYITSTKQRRNNMTLNPKHDAELERALNLTDDFKDVNNTP